MSETEKLVDATDEFSPETYTRFPVVLNRNAVAVLHIFTRHGCIEDLWMADCFCGRMAESEVAAGQLVEQFGDMVSPDFMIALRNAAQSWLQKHDGEFGTAFAEVG